MPLDPSPTLDLPAILARADQLAAARAKATAGPWEVDAWPHNESFHVRAENGKHHHCASWLLQPDAAFVALSRNLAIEADVRALVTALKRAWLGFDRLLNLVQALTENDGLTEAGVRMVENEILDPHRAAQDEDEVTL